MAELESFIQNALDAGYSGAQIQWHLMKELGYTPRQAVQAVNTAPREKMGPPQAPGTIAIPPDTSFGDAISRANPMPDWYQGAERRLTQPFLTTPITGGPLASLADVAPVIPQSKTEALLAAAALIPGGKLLKGARGALKAGTGMLEGAAPEVGALSRALEAGTLERAPRGKNLEFPIKWAIHPETGDVLMKEDAQNFDRHVGWFEEMGLPSAGDAFDRVPRGNLVVGPGPEGRELTDFTVNSLGGNISNDQFKSIMQALRKTGHLPR